MSRSINCPACGARMTLEVYEIITWQAWYACNACGLHSGSIGALTRRGAAIRAGRAMRGIIDAIRERARGQYAPPVRAAREAATRDHAHRVLMMLQDYRLTRAQITERMRQEAMG